MEDIQSEDGYTSPAESGREEEQAPSGQPASSSCTTAKAGAMVVQAITAAAKAAAISAVARPADAAPNGTDVALPGAAGGQAVAEEWIYDNDIAIG